jgi:hypothetical protein
MKYSRIETMTSPTPTDWTGLGVIWAITSGIVAIAYKWINSYFANKKTEKETFIRNVVQGVIDIALSAKLKAVDDRMVEMNGKINTLFDYREQDRNHIDGKFETMLREIRK